MMETKLFRTEAGYLGLYVDGVLHAHGYNLTYVLANLLGVERYEIEPGHTGAAPYDFPHHLISLEEKLKAPNWKKERLKAIFDHLHPLRGEPKGDLNLLRSDGRVYLREGLDTVHCWKTEEEFSEFLLTLEC